MRSSRAAVVVLGAALVIVTGCASEATSPAWTYTPVSAPSAGSEQTSAPSSELPSGPSSAPVAIDTGGASQQPVSSTPSDVAIHVSEWSVGVPTTIEAGPVNLSITNIGKIPHELLVFKSDLAPSAFPLDSHGNIIEDGPGITLVSDGDNIDPGGTQSRQADLSRPGTYLFVCNIPGHFKAGMYTVVNVTPTPPAVYLPVSLNEWHVAVQATIKAGTVNVEAANFGTIQHELLVFKSDLAPSAYPLDKDGNIIEDGAGINLISDGDNVDPNGTQSRSLDLTQPGTYLFVCNIPGHFKAGMFTVVTVVH
ncbi:MAG TPA: sulfocyanin-like copper-binding protein [Candidatus Limnocylindrales bacterium]